MGPIAATLLCYFDPERVYASLVRLHDSYALHNIFSPGFPGLLEAIYVQERITEHLMPDVYAAFKKHMISTTSYATKWYITLFANSVPFQTQLRLWDAFLLEGQDLFIAVAVCIVWVYRGTGLSVPSSGPSLNITFGRSYHIGQRQLRNCAIASIVLLCSRRRKRRSILDRKDPWGQEAAVEHGQVEVGLAKAGC